MFREDYSKEIKIVDKTEKQKEEDLYKDLEEAKINLNSLYENLNFVDGILVDYYTYQIKAEQARYRFFD